MEDHFRDLSLARDSGGGQNFEKRFFRAEECEGGQRRQNHVVFTLVALNSHSSISSFWRCCKEVNMRFTEPSLITELL